MKNRDSAPDPRVVRHRTNVDQFVSSSCLLVDEHLFSAATIASISGGASYSSRRWFTLRHYRAIWIREATDCVRPAALFASTCWGLGRCGVYAVLRYSRGEVVMEGGGDHWDVRWNARAIGHIEPSWRLRHLSCGWASIHDAEGRLVCRIRYPLFGPSSPRMRDCVGRVCFPAGCTMRFVIAPGTSRASDTSRAGIAPVGVISSTMQIALHGPEPADLFAWPPSCTATAVLPEVDSVPDLTDEHRAILLMAALWARTYSVGG